MGADLESAMMNWQLDLYGEFSAICVALQIGPDSGARDTRDNYMSRYDEWIRAASDPDSVENLYANNDLIKDVYIWETSRGSKPSIADGSTRSRAKSKLSRYRKASSLCWITCNKTREACAPPCVLGVRTTRRSRVDVAGLQPAQKLRSTAITGWQFDEGIPAIVHPIFDHTHPTSFRAGTPSRLDPVDWVVVVLNLETVRERILPGLTQRYFTGSAGLEYKLAVVEADKTPRLLYSSDPGFGVADISSSDSVMNIFGPPPESTEGSYWQTVKNSRSIRGEQWRSFSGPVWFPVIQGTHAGGPWLLVLQHRTGPLEATITKVWRSNLIIGGVILLLLRPLPQFWWLWPVSRRRILQVCKWISSHRYRTNCERHWRRSVSRPEHDGRVCSKFGVVRNADHIAVPATNGPGRSDSAVCFSASRETRCIHVGPVRLAEVFEDVRKNLVAVSAQAGFTVDFRPPIPAVWVLGDSKAIARCLQNLIGNAMKYSGKSRWIGVMWKRCPRSAIAG